MTGEGGSGVHGLHAYHVIGATRGAVRRLEEVLRKMHAGWLRGHGGALGGGEARCVVEQGRLRAERGVLLRRMCMKHAVRLRDWNGAGCGAVLCPAVTTCTCSIATLSSQLCRP